VAAAAKFAVKAISIVIGIPIGIATRKAIDRAWHVARPDNPPRKPSEEGVRLTDAIAWGALSAAAIVGADLLTRRGAEATYQAITGNPPPPGKQAKASKKLEKAMEKSNKE
jgi:uncharacterized protein DUF4235